MIKKPWKEEESGWWKGCKRIWQHLTIQKAPNKREKVGTQEERGMGCKKNKKHSNKTWRGWSEMKYFTLVLCELHFHPVP